MTWLDGLLRRRRIYDDLADEIRAHLDEKADELMARGMSPRDAREAARRAFGNVTNIQERGRDVWQWPTIESILLDIRYALVQMRRAPALSATVVLTLALGIAATTTVFSWARAVLLDPLPGAGAPSQVYALETTTASGTWTPTSWLDYRDFRRYLKSFDGLAAAYPTSLALGNDAGSERAWGELVSANFFDVLQVRPVLGGLFPSNSDDAEGAQPVAVISYALWQRRWQGDPHIVGRTVEINRSPFTIVGVTPPAFHGSMPGEQTDLWVPAGMLGRIVPTGGWWLNDRGTRTFRVLGRLKAGVSFPAARDEVDRFTAFMAKVNGGPSTGMRGLLMPVWQSHWGMQDALRAPIVVLLAACGLVLIIVCANAANLLLARAVSRRRELWLRLALGAPRRRLVRQLLTEASILAITGSALGLAATVWLARSLRTLVPPFAARALLPPHVDGAVLAFTAILAACVTLLAGVAPALHGSREARGDALSDGARNTAGSVHATRIRGALVTAEMALAIVALVGAGLFLDSVRNTRGVSPGFEPDHVAMASVSLTLAGYDSARGASFLRDVAARVRRQPGVSDASYTDYVPLSVGSGSWEELRVEGYAPQPGESMKLARAAIGPDYFSTMGIPLVDGRDFTAGDDSAHTAVMIVNQAFVRHFLAGRTALGVRVHGWGRWFTIVGVAQDSKTYRLTESPTPYFYVPVRQVYRPEYGYTFVARTAGSVDQTVRAIGQAVRAVDPAVSVFDAMPLTAYIQGPLLSEQIAARFLAILAAVSALLAAIGLYGVISYAVAQRTKEIGVRVALGAARGDVMRVVAGEARTHLILGLVLGLGAALAMSRLVSSMLYSVGSGSAGVFAGAAVGMVAIAMAAIAVPARRAMRVDPLVALRAE